MDKEYAKYLLDKTRDDYNLISDDFSRTRMYISDDINALKDYIREGDKILDLGCGNGRFVELLADKKVNYTGADNSEKLIDIAKVKYPGFNFITIPSLSLPFSDNSFNKVFSLAVFHHIPSEELRSAYLREIKRVMKPGGTLILTVWNLYQKKTAFYLLLKSFCLKILGKSKMDFFDIFIPWKNSDRKILAQRYFHLFTKKKLSRLAVTAGFKIKKIETIKRGRGKYSNVFLVAEK